MASYSAIYWPALCGSGNEYDAFWSDQLTLNTSTPDLTSCFQNTVLIWVPCGLLWLMTPVYAVYVAKRDVYNPWTSCSKMNFVKLVGGFVLTMLALFRLVYKAVKLETESVTTADLSSSLLLLATFSLATFYTKWCFRKGLQNSGPLLTFWLLLLLADILTVRSQTMMRRASDPIFISLCIEVALVSLEFLLSCAADTGAEMNNTSYKDEERPLLLESSPQTDGQKLNPCPKETASILSKTFFFWVLPKIIHGSRKKLGLSDLWDIMDELSAQHNYFMFFKQWKKELSKRFRDSDNTIVNCTANSETAAGRNDIKTSKELAQPSIIWALVKTLFPYFSLSSLCLLIYVTASLIGPIILRSLIAFIEEEDFSWKGYALAVMLYFVSLTTTISLQHQFDVTTCTTIKLRSALVNAVYRKVLLVSSAARRNVTVGYIVNLVSVDIMTLLRTIQLLNYLWATPLLVLACMVLLWQQIGPSCLSGLALLLILMPSNAILLAQKLKQAQRDLMQLKERRLKMTSQVLSGIKVLKLYAWEPYFETCLQEMRRVELLKLRKVTLLLSLTFASWLASPFLVALACFMTYVVSSADHVLDAEKTFVSMSIINTLYQPLAQYSQVMSNTVQGYVSLKRIENFILEEELEQPPRHISSDNISVHNGTFTWEAEETPCLKNINLSVGRGHLVAVVGTVGSGKSSLLSALLGELNTLSGSVSMQGSVAYVPQQAWIQNLTLRDNILFSKDMKREKYEAVLNSCALKPDLKTIPGGDMTEIGEKGINLSGGQKQRVSLARAVYSDRDIYLLDDPLSAVDAHVSKHIFDEVIGSMGLLKDKTRLLVTHGISHLPQMDSIIVMKDGCVSEVGTFQELLHNKAAFAEFIHEYMASSGGEGENQDSSDHIESFGGSSGDIGKHRKRKASVGSTGTAKTREDDGQMVQLISEEETNTGLVKLSVPIYLIRAAGCASPCLLLASVLLFLATQSMTQLWLRDWSQGQPINGTQSTVQLRLTVYGGLAVFQLVSIIGISCAIAFGGMKASFNLHSRLLHSVLRSPMSFFDTTPLGRILNRFSRDTDAVDQLIPMSTQMFLSNGVAIVAMILVMFYTLPLCAAAIVPLAIVICAMQRLYMSVASQLQRLDAICRSPLYAFFEETITGVSPIRAYGYEKQFTKRMEKLLNESQSAWFELFASNRILMASIQVVGNLAPASTAILCILYRDTLDPSSLGMAISLSMQVSQMLSMCIRTMGDLEIQIVSVERIKEYSELSSEAPWKSGPNKPVDDWPNEGGVEFKDYQTRYRPGLQPVLKGINLQIMPREKVGVVGRTGAGKSSLTFALFRLIEADKGVIRIDGKDISELGLHDLRGRISVIPQDPVLFSGTLRFNVDPSGECSDLDIWNALEHSHLKQFIESLPDGLQHMCDEGGWNLSVGQRQLVCLARALLRMSKILVLDEATAAVDMETDDLIQSTISSKFKQCTVITVAHRLNTIMEYDRVIVMEDGNIREFDSPENLIAVENSLFYEMAKHANLV